MVKEYAHYPKWVKSNDGTKDFVVNDHIEHYQKAFEDYKEDAFIAENPHLQIVPTVDEDDNPVNVLALKASPSNTLKPRVGRPPKNQQADVKLGESA